MNLSDIFTGVAFKVLRSVDLPSVNSNQHEINGVDSLKSFFGTTETLKGKILWHYFKDGKEPVNSEGSFTFYDARARSSARTHRTEWRLYYKGDFLSDASSGDFLILARNKNGKIHGLVFQKDSVWLRFAQNLFGFSSCTSEQFQQVTDSVLQHQELEFLRMQFLQTLGIEASSSRPEDDEKLVYEKFGEKFPTTLQMSEFARSVTAADVNPLEDPDSAILVWLQREEDLFKALEKIVVGKKLTEGFESVDDFIQYSLSVQNRRKSRMGYALMNHLSAIFNICKLRYEREALTERKNRPDFLFPGSREYHDPEFDPTLLVMLGAKSSVKERWRQILSEADRITSKHLCTLEQGISREQFNEMKEQRVMLVIPSRLRSMYMSQQKLEILSLREFIDFIKDKQN